MQEPVAVRTMLQLLCVMWRVRSEGLILQAAIQTLTSYVYERQQPPILEWTEQDGFAKRSGQKTLRPARRIKVPRMLRQLRHRGTACGEDS
jgi:hypothetical protein